MKWAVGSILCPNQSSHNLYSLINHSFTMKTTILFIAAFLALSFTAHTSPTDVVKKYYAYADAGNTTEVAKLLADEFMISSPLAPQPMPKEAWLGVLRAFKMAFSDLKHEVTAYTEADFTVVARGFLTGKNDGSLMGAPPTGNRVNTGFNVIFELDKSMRIKVIYGQFDLKTFEAQLMGGDPNAKMETAKQNIRAAYDALNRHDWDAFAALCDPDKYTDINTGPVPMAGVKQALEGYKQFFDAFSNLKIAVTEIGAVSPTRFLVKVTLTGKHTSNLMGVPATGKMMHYDDCDIVELDAQGKIVLHQPLKGGAEVFRQIGVDPDAKPVVKTVGGNQ